MITSLKENQWVVGGELFELYFTFIYMSKSSINISIVYCLLSNMFQLYCFIFAGNKCDKLSGRTVSSSDGEHFARKHNMMSFSETSAKDGRNVDDAFYKLAQVSNGKRR